MSEAFYCEPIVTRKPELERIQFECRCCMRVVTVDPWNPKRNEPPICGYCVGHWGNTLSMRSGITRADVRLLQRVSALTARLEWEAINA